MKETKDLKNKINSLIEERQKFIIQKYSKSGNVLPSVDDIINCRNELIEDPIITELNRQLVEIAQKSTNIEIHLEMEDFLRKK